MPGFRIAEGFVEVTVDDSHVTPGVQRALQTAAVQSRQAAQAAGQHLGQHLAAGIQDAAQDGTRRAGQQGGEEFSGGFLRSSGAALKAGIAGVAVGAGAVFMKGFGEALSQGKVTSKLQAQLGSTPAEAKRYGDVAGRLYTSGITDTFEEGADVIKSVMQQGLLPPGATNAQIQSIAGKVTDLSKTFDMDLGGATNAVAQMMKTGLAKNATEALDLLTRGAQKGADKAGDLADTFNEYSTQFRKVGLDGATSMGLISQGLKAGARDADLVADSIKEFSIRAIDGSKTTVDGFKSLGLNADDMAARIGKGGKSSARALDLTLDKLRGIKDPVERSRIAVELFGTQAEDMGAALYALDPSKAVDTLGKVGGAAEKMGKTLHSGPGQQITVFKRTLEQGIVNFVGTYVVPALMKFGDFLRTALTPAFKTVKSAVTGFIGSMGGVPGIMSTVTGVLTSFGKLVLAAVVPVVQGLAESARKNLVPAFRDIWSLLKTNLVPVLEGLVPVMKTVGSAVGAAIVPTLNALMVAVRKTVGFIKEWQDVFVPLAVGIAAFTLVLNAQKIAIAAWTAVTRGASVVTRAWAVAQGLFNAVMAANPIVLVVAALVGLAAALVVAYKKSETFRNIVNGAWASIKAGLSVAWEYIKKVFDRMKNLFLNFTGPGLLIKHWDTIKSATKAAFDWVKQKISDVFTFLKNVFLNFTGPGLLIKHWNDIKSSTGSAWNWIKNTVKGALTWVQDRISSGMNAVKTLWTSTWTAIRDFFTTRWNNIKSGVSAAWKWLKDSFTSLKTAITGTWSAAWNTIRDFFKTRWSNVKSGVSAAWSWLKDSFTKLKTSVTRTWSDAWNAIKEKFTGTWSSLKRAISTAWSWLKSAFTSTKNAVTKTWSDAWTAIKNKFTSVWAAIRTAVTAAWNWLKGSFTSTKNTVTKTWGDAWTAIKTKFTSTWNTLKGLVSTAWSWLKSSFTSTKTSITRTWSDAWNAVYSKAATLWGKIKSGVNSFKTAIVSAFNKAKDGVGAAWNKLSDIAKKPVNFIIGTVYTKGIKALWDKVAKWVGLGALPKAPKLLAAGGTVGPEPGVYNKPTAIVGEGGPHPEYVIPTDPKYRKRALALYQQAGTQLMEDGGILGHIWGGIKSGASAVGSAAKTVGGYLKDKAKDLAEGALEPFFKAGMKVVNGLLDKIPGVNTGYGKLMKAVPAKVASSILGFLKSKDEESAGGADVAGALKWARTQAGKPYQWGGAGNPSWDCSGFMGGIQKKIDGSDPKGRIWSTFSFQGSHAPAGWQRHLKAPFMIGITNKGVGHTAGTLGGVNVESRGGAGVLVGSRARGYNNSLFTDWYGYKPSKGGGDWSAKGTGVARWRPNVIRELQHLGLSTGWQDTVLRRMNQESGGDPNVVNKWDSNWKAGHPSVGLMQVIGPTFAAYAGSHRNTGPFKYGTSVNPNANIHAGLNYAQHQYGSLSALNRAGGYDSGGWLPPGATLAINKTGKPEAVLTNEEAQTFRRMVQNPDQLGGVNVVINWSSLTVPSKSEFRKVALQLRDELREVERARR
ncbi:phage tail tape measure protein [Streptomyces griseoaurantiacus]|uniref:Phage tail tape measure protein n=1 Tax=Streptomyces griseoaurantiacus TaxID=68213 RepID=A0A7W2HUJ4_9ACTN|nr:phage tail tape measure protein [Streptomyces griseoaurantiacus]MBA5222217.1 phage tail tape measure protein [Streptomyces griseoaurantiacus]